MPTDPRASEGPGREVVLYHCLAARSFRPLWTLEELQASYRLVLLPFPPRIHAKEFLEVNPLGTVPALRVGDLTLTESVAICQYLVATHASNDLAVRADEPDFGYYLDWLQYGEATLTFPQTLVLRYGRFESPVRRSPQVVDDYSRWFLARARRLVPVLEGRRYLCSGRFTLADVSVGYALLLASYIEPLWERLPALLRRYAETLQSRPGFQRAACAETEAAAAQNVSTTPAPLTT
jgi:glutathione S-transferase